MENVINKKFILEYDNFKREELKALSVVDADNDKLIWTFMNEEVEMILRLLRIEEKDNE